MADNLIVKLGADTSEFRGELARVPKAANEAMDGVSTAVNKPRGPLSELKRGFKELRDIFLVSGGLTLVLGWFDSLAERAQKSKDNIDQNIDSTRRWGEEWKDIKDTIADFGVQILGVLAKTGRGLADFFMAIEAGKRSLWSGDGFVAGFTKAWQEIQAGNKAEEETRKGLQETTRLIKEANDNRRTTAAINAREREAERKRLETLKANFDFQQDMKKLDEEIAKAKYDLLTPEKQLVELQRQKAVQQKIINDYLVNEEDKKKAILESAKLEKDIGEKTLEIEKAKTKELEEQNKKRKEARFDLGVAKSIGGFQTYFDPAKQQEYEKMLLDSAARDIQQEISTLQKQVDSYKMSGAGIGKFELPALQSRIQALRGRQSNISDYVFNPNYQDAAGQGIFASQVSTIGDPLKLQNRQTDVLTEVSKGVSELNTRLQVNGFGTNR